jgi:hypothetical protein
MGIVKMPLDAQTCYLAIQALRLLIHFEGDFRSEFMTLPFLPLLARLVVSHNASGSSLQGFHLTRRLQYVDDYSYWDSSILSKSYGS